MIEERNAAQKPAAIIRVVAPTRRAVLQAGLGSLAVAALPIGLRAASVQASKADDFIKFQSCQFHPSWTSTERWANPGWRPYFADLGVRYARGLIPNAPARAHCNDLYARWGIRSTASFNTWKSDGTFDLANTDKWFEWMKSPSITHSLGVHKVVGIEGPNEYTNDFDDVGWAKRFRDFQGYLWNKVQSDPAYKARFDAGQLEVVSGSIHRKNLEHYQDVADLGGLQDRCTEVNLHLYNVAMKPSRYPGKTGNDPIVEALQDAQIMAPGIPVRITETGFNMTDSYGGKTDVSTCTANIGSKYLARMVCEYWLLKLQGDLTSFSYYSLLDSAKSDTRWGLVDYNDNTNIYTPRLPYWTWRNLNSYFVDATWNSTAQAWSYPTFTPMSIGLEISGGNEDIKHFVLQKADGRFYLVIWHDAVSWDRQKKRELAVSRVPVDVKVTMPSFSGVRVFEPTMLDGENANAKRDTPVFTGGSPNFTINVPDHVVVAELRP